MKSQYFTCLEQPRWITGTSGFICLLNYFWESVSCLTHLSYAVEPESWCYSEETAFSFMCVHGVHTAWVQLPRPVHVEAGNWLQDSSSAASILWDKIPEPGRPVSPRNRPIAAHSALRVQMSLARFLGRCCRYELRFSFVFGKFMWWASSLPLSKGFEGAVKLLH